jgi:hypothetical protein
MPPAQRGMLRKMRAIAACAAIRSIASDLARGILVRLRFRSRIMKPSRQRRLYPWIRCRRVRHLTRLSCQVVRERDFQLVADRIVDLSPSGLRVGPADPVLTGERLLISFQLPWALEWVDAEVRVARVIHGRRPFEHTRSLGLEFESILSGNRAPLEHAIAGLPIVPPHWRPGRRRGDLTRLIRTSSRPAEILSQQFRSVIACT